MTRSFSDFERKCTSSQKRPAGSARIMSNGWRAMHSNHCLLPNDNSQCSSALLCSTSSAGHESGSPRSARLKHNELAKSRQVTIGVKSRFAGRVRSESGMPQAIRAGSEARVAISCASNARKSQVVIACRAFMHTLWLLEHKE